MNDTNNSRESGRATIGGRSISKINGVTLDQWGAVINIKDRERINIFAFNSFMFPNETNRIGLDEYVLSGPCLGIYSDTDDPREGPYVNHFIKELSISITYYSADEAWINISGSADLSKSSYGYPQKKENLMVCGSSR